MWDHRCKVLHKNYFSNKVQDLNNIDLSIRSLLRIATIKLRPQDRWPFYVTESFIFTQTPKFRREWQVKADTIHSSHLSCISNPLTHRKGKMAIQRLLKVTPRSTHMTPKKLPTQNKERKFQNKIKNWFTPSTVW